MLNHLIRTAKSHLGNAIQCRGSGGGLSRGFIMLILKENMFQNKWCFYGSLVCPVVSVSVSMNCMSHSEPENIL